MNNRYNAADYQPPIPILSVHFGYGARHPWLGPYSAIVDTGADATSLLLGTTSLFRELAPK